MVIVVGVIIIKMIAPWAVLIGALMALFGFIYLLASREDNEQALVGVVIIIVGLAVFGIGAMTVDFFYHDPVGIAASNGTTEFLNKMGEVFNIFNR